jgi:hypothetical protein
LYSLCKKLKLDFFIHKRYLFNLNLSNKKTKLNKRDKIICKNIKEAVFSLHKISITTSISLFVITSLNVQPISALKFLISTSLLVTELIGSAKNGRFFGNSDNSLISVGIRSDIKKTIIHINNIYIITINKFNDINFFKNLLTFQCLKYFHKKRFIFAFINSANAKNKYAKIKVSKNIQRKSLKR